MPMIGTYDVLQSSTVTLIAECVDCGHREFSEAAGPYQNALETAAQTLYEDGWRAPEGEMRCKDCAKPD